MSKIYKNVAVEYRTCCHFEIEISDKELEFAKECRINIEDDEELVKFHLENNFGEHVDLLDISDFEFEAEED